jgi:hypothetical protein
MIPEVMDINKMITVNKENLYKQTLSDLQDRRSKCLEDLRKLDSAINALSATMTASGLVLLSSPPPPPPGLLIPPPPSSPTGSPELRYANMSVRWAILKLFSEQMPPGEPVTTADISAFLLDGGNEKATKPTVSAVISDMVKRRSELQSTEGGSYTLTDNGRAAWSAIAHSARYLNRDLSASEE